MAYIISTFDTNYSEASAPGMFRRLLSAIMRAREAQAQYRLKSQLRDLHGVLEDIDLRGRPSKGKSSMMLHMG